MQMPVHGGYKGVVVWEVWEGVCGAGLVWLTFRFNSWNELKKKKIHTENTHYMSDIEISCISPS